MIIIILTFSSCELVFHKEDNEYYVLDNNQEKFDLLNGVYYNIAKAHNEDYFTMLCRSDDVNAYQYFKLYNEPIPPVKESYCSSDMQIDFVSISASLYQKLYSAIVSINRLESLLDDSTDAYLFGEIYFLRAYCYFKLARLYGTPPLVTDINVSYTIEKPSFVEVYELIETDLLNAIDLLPSSYTDSRIVGETPHQGTAKALLAEVYLAWAGYPVNDETKYELAAQYSSDVIEHAADYNFELLSDYADLWDDSNRHNNENIFGLFYNSENEQTSNYIGNYLKKSEYHPGLVAGHDIYIDEDIFDLNFEIRTYPLGSLYHPEMNFYNSFPNNYRKQVSMITGVFWEREYYYLGEKITGNQFIPFEPDSFPCDYVQYSAYLKWIDMDKINPHYRINNIGTENTLYLLRFAQTLLTYAEAGARSGNLDASCYEAVNRIRRRANHLDQYTVSDVDLKNGLTSEQFLDSVVWERAWELAMEPDGRWFDIVRLNLIDEINNTRAEQEFPTEVDAEYLTDEWYFFKIPQEDIWLNPNLE